MTSFNTPVRVAAASLAAVFALSACSSSEEDGSADGAEGSVEPAENDESVTVFDFSEDSTGSEAIEFRVPDEVIEMDEEYREGRLFESITVTAAEAEDPSECAVRYDFDLTGVGVESLDRRAQIITEEGEITAEEGIFYHLTGSASNDVDITDDFTSAVVPLRCAPSPTDSSSTSWVRMYQRSESGNSGSFFLSAELSVMQSGELFVHKVQRSRWEADSNGSWIRK